MSLYLFLKTFILSFYTTILNPTNLHNNLKFQQIYQIWSSIKQDNIIGDYTEFGVFKGKSLYHSWRCAKKHKIKNVMFYGFDSFEGFPVENHDLYTNEKFKTTIEKVNKNFRNKNNVELIQGFFDQSLKQDRIQSIKNISFAFIDCDIYESSISIFNFLENRVSVGGFIMIDDFSSIDKNGNSIYKAWEENKKINQNFIFYSNYSNGQVFRRIK